MNVDAKSGLLSVCESVCERRKREGKAMKPTRCTCDLPLCAGVNVLNTESREIKQRECHQYLHPVTIQVCRLSLRSLNSVTEEIHASPCEIVMHVARIQGPLQPRVFH